MLDGKEELMDTHEGRMKAYGEVVGELDPDEVEGVVVSLIKNDGVDVLTSVTPEADGISSEMLMLGAHIHNVMTTINEMDGGYVDAKDVAVHAASIVMQSEEDASGGMSE